VTLEAADFRFNHCLFNMSALTLQLPPVLKLTDEQFEQLAAANQDLQLELTAKGELIIMPPTGGETGNRNFEVYIDLGILLQGFGCLKVGLVPPMRLG
jgi:hypothetical protein